MMVRCWLAYGAALNEGRALFPGDKEFGRWVSESVLGQVAQGEVEPKDLHLGETVTGNVSSEARTYTNKGCRRWKGEVIY